ncbi:hypothetical protein ACSNOI_22310 [Actinomadura kijaniata]|uniref:hypothetical protein n=1 Tax=Actinomadura kijaniata TaxID=46161 RepID=UPI003F1B5A14
MRTLTDRFLTWATYLLPVFLVFHLAVVASCLLVFVRTGYLAVLPTLTCLFGTVTTTSALHTRRTRGGAR